MYIKYIKYQFTNHRFSYSKYMTDVWYDWVGIFIQWFPVVGYQGRLYYEGRRNFYPFLFLEVKLDYSYAAITKRWRERKVSSSSFLTEIWEKLCIY